MKGARLMSSTNSLPLEALIEILSWLPIKSLMRFRCVSKTWLRLLTTDPHFIQLHQTNANNKTIIQNPSIIVLRNDGREKALFYYAQEYSACHEATLLDFPFNISTRNHYAICGICNGLLCLTDFFHVYVWNPLTSQHISIPLSPLPPPTPEDGPKYIPKNNFFAFGFRQATNQYKVIRLVSTPKFKYSAPDSRSHVSVFTLGTDDSWRTLVDIPYRINLEHLSSALVNEALHWFATRPGSSSWSVLLSFDMKDEFFREIPQPNGLAYEYPNFVSVAELDGLLSMFSRLLEEDVQIWVMKEYGVVNSWTKQFKIGTSEIPDMFGWLEPLGVTNQGEIIIKKDTWELILYDPKTNSIRNLNTFGFQLLFDAYGYIGSLVSPKLLMGSGTSMG